MSRNRTESKSPARRGSYSDYTDSRSESPYSDDSYESGSSYRRANKTSSKPVRRSAPKGSKGKKGKQQNGPGSPRSWDVVTKRMLSARRIKINELKNESESLNQQLLELREENKLLKRQHHIQTRQLNRYEGQESDMPLILQRHGEEVRTLKEQLRRQKDKFQKTDKKLKDTQDELDRTKRLLRKMKGLVDDKELGERDDLSRKLSKLEVDVEEKDKRIKELERHLDHLNKNHKHELGIERARHKETQRNLDDLHEQHNMIATQLKEKDKELEVRNIYAMRAARPPHKLNSSVSSSPLPERGLPPRRRKNSTPGMTPRERARMFEDKRRDELRRQREFLYNESSFLEGQTASKRPWSIPARAQEQRDRERMMAEEKDPWRQSDGTKKQEQKTNDWLNKLEDDADKQNEKKRQEEEQKKEEERWEEIEDKKKEDEERQWRLDREKRKMESDALKAKQDEDRKQTEERQKREQEEQDRKNKEERSAREREEKERREREERQRQEREERERKDREERERKELEDQEKQAREEAERLKYDVDEQNRRQQKDDLLAKLRAIDTKKSTQEEVDGPLSPQSSKKDYQFTKPIENMHHGRPAYNVKVPVVEKNRRKGNLFDDDDANGYQPSFGPSTKSAKKRNKFFDDDDNKSDTSIKSLGKDKKKSNLMNDLFTGSSNKSSAKAKEDEPLFSSSAKRTVKPSRESSSTVLFGGGNAIIDDEPPPHSNSHLLPRRVRQPTTTVSSRPTVNAVDDIDDDIEEVVL